MTSNAKQEVPVETGSRESRKPAVSPPSALMQPYEAFEQFMENMLSRDWWPRAAHWRDPFPELMTAFQLRRPALDMIDEDERVVVRAELPGVDRKDLKVSISDHLLTIKATAEREKRERTAQYYRREISRSEFDRSVELPRSVDTSKVEATLSNGMLVVTVAKSRESQRRTVEVK